MWVGQAGGFGGGRGLHSHTDGSRAPELSRGNLLSSQGDALKQSGRRAGSDPSGSTVREVAGTPPACPLVHSMLTLARGGPVRARSTRLLQITERMETLLHGMERDAVLSETRTEESSSGRNRRQHGVGAQGASWRVAAPATRGFLQFLRPLCG